MKHTPEEEVIPQNDQSAWRELALLHAENAALRATLRQYGHVCRLAGQEMLNFADGFSADRLPRGSPPGS